MTDCLEVVIITNLGKDKNLHKMLKIQQIFQNLYRGLLYVVFHNLESQNTGLVGDKKDLNDKKNQRVILCSKIENISIVIKNSH